MAVSICPRVISPDSAGSSATGVSSGNGVATVKEVTSSTLSFRLKDSTTFDASGYNNGTVYLFDSNGNLITSISKSGSSYGTATVDYGESGSFTVIGAGVIGTEKALGLQGEWQADQTNKYYQLDSMRVGTISPKVFWEGAEYSSWNDASINCSMSNYSAGTTGVCMATEDGGIGNVNSTDTTETISLGNGETMSGIEVHWRADTANTIYGNEKAGGLLIVVEYPVATYEDFGIKDSNGNDLAEAAVPSQLSNAEKAFIWPVSIKDYASKYFTPIYTAKAEPSTATAPINISVMDYDYYIGEDGLTVKVGVEDDDDGDVGGATDSVTILHS